MITSFVCLKMWERKKPVLGDQIRVRRTFYTHHGIYVSDDCVIHFAPEGNTDVLDPKSARIIKTTLAEFLHGGILEVRVYTEEELKKRRSPFEIVQVAFSRLGEGGYDLLTNNCEHFSNECAFGEKKSEQVEKVLSFFS